MNNQIGYQAKETGISKMRNQTANGPVKMDL